MSSDQISLNAAERQTRDAVKKTIGTKGTLVSVKQRGKDGVFVHIVSPADFASVARALESSGGDIAREAGVDLHVTLASSWKPSAT